MAKWIFFIMVLVSAASHAWLQEPTREMEEAVAPYLLPKEHPVAPILDEIFGSSRVTTKLRTLEKAGFTDIDLRKRGIVFARHPKLPGFVMKLVLDYKGHSQNKWMKTFRKQDEYIEFTGRVRKRNEIQNFIDAHRLDGFITPKKWIYPLPTHVNPPKNRTMVKKFYILVAEYIDLQPKDLNFELWKTVPDEDFLNAYFFIATALKLQDLGPSNQPFTKSGHIAFIDTKDWKEGEFDNIRKIPSFLSREMGVYWKYLLKNGLPENWQASPLNSPDLEARQAG